MDFSSDGAFTALEGMDEGDLDALPFGVVGMTPDGSVTIYNRTESELAGLSRDTVVGHNFFYEVAPCMNNFMVAQKMFDAPALDETLPYVLTVRMRPTKVKLRMLKGEDAERMYLLIDRQS